MRKVQITPDPCHLISLAERAMSYKTNWLVTSYSQATNLLQYASMKFESFRLGVSVFEIILLIFVIAACRPKISQKVHQSTASNPLIFSTSTHVNPSPFPISTLDASNATSILAGATKTPSPIRTITITSSPIRSWQNKLGIHLLLDDGRNQWPQQLWGNHLSYARKTVGEWGFVIELVRLDDLDPEKWQFFMDLCELFQLTPVLRLATTYDQEAGYWLAPTKGDDGSYDSIGRDYARFVAALTWPTNKHYIIVGNEPNHGNEWGGKPQPEDYARYLIDVSANVRVDRKSVV